MSKAYDRAEWSFLEAMLRNMNFGDRVSRVMQCVRSVSFTILLNGFSGDSFSSQRGLTQGDPLSPYLFVICVEGLSSLLSKAERNQLRSFLQFDMPICPKAF